MNKNFTKTFLSEIEMNVCYVILLLYFKDSLPYFTYTQLLTFMCLPHILYIHITCVGFSNICMYDEHIYSII